MTDPTSQAKGAAGAPAKDAKPKKNFINTIVEAIEKWKKDKERKADALKKKNATPASGGPATSSPVQVGAATKVNKAVLYNPFGWIKQMFFWSNAQVLLVLLTCLMVWGLVYLINQRKLVVIDLPKNLEQRVFDTYKQNNFDRDEVERFVVNSLVILRSFDFRSSGNIPLLQGLFNPDILTKVQQSYSANKDNITRTGMIQVLAPPQVTTLFVEEEMVNKNKMVKRAQVYVSGYLMVTTLPKGKSQFTKVIPYRAQLQVLRMPQSKINRGNYYLSEITEVAGEEQVKRFDALVQREKEKRGLK
jgi:hypothetical protein